MKSKLIFLAAAFFSLRAFGQLQGSATQEPVADNNSPISDKPTIVERGAHHRVWRSVSASTNQAGQVNYSTNSYTELATGLHYQKDGQWTETKAEIELTDNGAAATNGPHKVYFAANLNTTNALDVTTADGKRLRSHVTGLSYFDSSSGQAVLIAETKDSVGYIQGKNEVIYTNAFDDVAADVQYVYTKAGLEQNVILRAQVPAPSQFGLNPDTTRLQVITEFYDPPTPQQKVAAPSQMLPLTDNTLDFGKMRMGAGKAFSIGEDRRLGKSLRVAKHWSTVEKRTFLVEEIPFKQAAERINALERQNRGASIRSPINGKGGDVLMALRNSLPEVKLAANTPPQRMRLALNTPAPAEGFVMDYDLHGSFSDFTFEGDKTYAVTDWVSLDGTTTLEGGAVIKYCDSSAVIWVYDALICKTAPYRPAIFTSKDDNSVGVQISGSSGTPSISEFAYMGGYDGGAIWNIQNVRFSFCYLGFIANDHGLTVRNCQFVNNTYGIGSDQGDVTIENCLFSNCDTPLYGNEDVILRHVTADTFSTFCTSIDGFSSLNFVNSLITGSGAWTGRLNPGTGSLPTPVFDHSEHFSSSAGIFQTVGAGSYYLADGSPYRNAGRADLSATLLADLRRTTTYPPVTIESNIVTSVVLQPQAQRDTDLPDLGYHYPPLDYAANNVYVKSGAKLTLTNGVVLCGYGSAQTLYFEDNTALISLGSTLQRNTLTRNTTVQEQSVWWTRFGFVGFGSALWNLDASSAVNINFQFTDMFLAGARAGHSDISWARLNSDFSFSDCATYGSTMVLLSGNYTTSTMQLRNNLFWRSIITLTDFDENESGHDGLYGYGELSLSMYNNLFYRGTLGLFHGNANSPWVIEDNAFDAMYIAGNYFDEPYISSHNGYINTGALADTSGNDVSVSSFTYQSGALGDFYQSSTSFINAGSRTAGAAGLYHYTVKTSNVKDGTETPDTVDIGLHYVAVDSNGVPLDYDGDGVPDYIEDRNGDGDGGNDSTHWQTYNSKNRLSTGSGLQVFTPLK